MSKYLALAALMAAAAHAQVTPTKPTKLPSSAKPAPAAFDKIKFEAYVRHLLLWGPQITVAVADPVAGPMPGYKEVKVTGSFQQVSLDEVFYVGGDGKKIVRGTVYDIDKSPFSTELALLKTDLSPSIGTPGAPAVIVVFSDFQCAFCRDEAKMLRENLVKTFPKEVRLYFKDFPIEQIHPWAKSAAIAGRCVFRQNPAAFWEFHDWIFDKQAEMTVENLKAKIGEWGAQKGLDSMQLARCYDNRSSEGEILRSVAEGRALKVTSTPTLFVNGRQMPGSVPWAQLKAIIDWEIDYSKKTGQTVEKCCELSLPTPGKQ